MMSVAALWLTQGNSSSVYGPLFKQVNTGLQCWASFRISGSNEPAIPDHVIIFGWGQREEAQTVTHLHACIHTLGKCLRPPSTCSALSYRGYNWEFIHTFGLTSVFMSQRFAFFFMLGDKEGGQGAPPRGCILGAAWLGIEPRTASLKVDILTEGHSGTKVMPTLHVVLIFLTFFLKQKRKQNL